jgi:hypothetical protein
MVALATGYHVVQPHRPIGELFISVYIINACVAYCRLDALGPK